MAVAQTLTYASLLTDVQAYAERSDSAFVAQIPRFIMLAENRIASEARGLGFIQSVTDNLVIGVNGSVLNKPARWRETVSLQIGIGAGFNARVFIFSRSYEYCRSYWPDPTQVAQPKYYADWTWANWLIVPSPDLAYPFELLYHERPQPLDDNNSTNWTTTYAPQLLLYACLLEAAPFVKRADLTAQWQSSYDRALQQVAFEQKRRASDRAGQSTNTADAGQRA